MNTYVITIGRDEDVCETVRSIMLNNITGMDRVLKDSILEILF